jgi:hypothetical protein
MKNKFGSIFLLVLLTGIGNVGLAMELPLNPNLVVVEAETGFTGSQTGDDEMETPGKFIHTVLFWLKEGTTPEKKQQLIGDCKSLLGAISTVRYIAVGNPAGTPREVVDNSYSVGLVVHFDDKAGHDYYQEAEKHVQFIERNQECWLKVQVYDLKTQ